MTTNKRDSIRESKLAKGLPEPLLDAALSIPREDIDAAITLLDLMIAWKEGQSNE